MQLHNLSGVVGCTRIMGLALEEAGGPRLQARRRRRGSEARAARYTRLLPLRPRHGQESCRLPHRRLGLGLRDAYLNRAPPSGSLLRTKIRHAPENVSSGYWPSATPWACLHRAHRTSQHPIPHFTTSPPWRAELPCFLAGCALIPMTGARAKPTVRVNESIQFGDGLDHLQASTVTFPQTHSPHAPPPVGTPSNRKAREGVDTHDRCSTVACCAASQQAHLHLAAKVVGFGPALLVPVPAVTSRWRWSEREAAGR